jgi:hypothetical protein
VIIRGQIKKKDRKLVGVNVKKLLQDIKQSQGRIPAEPLKPHPR